MAWLGVPFKLLEGVDDSISLSVRALPNIVLKVVIQTIHLYGLLLLFL